MGNFNAYHNFWEPALPRSWRNYSGRSLLEFLVDSVSFSLITSGLSTRIDEVSGNPSTFDLCLGNGPLFHTTVTTGPYMGSDHLPVIFPSCHCHPPLLSHRPCWSFEKGDWDTFQLE
uniref:Endonuclease/exonuclease/phosphatase domain-containing protein n=1 Tax=Scylla olivacea TaxID=85551 RepID=A0A0P4W6C6_SCYOL